MPLARSALPERPEINAYPRQLGLRIQHHQIVETVRVQDPAVEARDDRPAAQRLAAGRDRRSCGVRINRRPAVQARAETREIAEVARLDGSRGRLEGQQTYDVGRDADE